MTEQEELIMLRALVKKQNKAIINHPEEIDRLLPWSDELPKECRLAQKHKKHLKK